MALALNFAPVMTPGQVGDPAMELSDEDAEAVAGSTRCSPAVPRARAARRVSRRAARDHRADRAASATSSDGDLAAISQPIDLLGDQLLHAVRRTVPAGEPADPAYPGSADILFCTVPTAGDRDGLADRPERHSSCCSAPFPGLSRDRLMVTENGADFEDVMTGRRRSRRRQDQFLEEHLRALPRADRGRCAGQRISASGRCWTTSSGPTAISASSAIVHVDFATQRRLPKDSALLVPRGHQAQRPGREPAETAHPGGRRRPRRGLGPPSPG